MADIVLHEDERNLLPRDLLEDRQCWLWTTRRPVVLQTFFRSLRKVVKEGFLLVHPSSLMFTGGKNEPFALCADFDFSAETLRRHGTYFYGLPFGSFCAHIDVHMLKELLCVVTDPDALCLVATPDSLSQAQPHLTLYISKGEPEYVKYRLPIFIKLPQHPLPSPLLPETEPMIFTKVPTNKWRAALSTTHSARGASFAFTHHFVDLHVYGQRTTPSFAIHLSHDPHARCPDCRSFAQGFRENQAAHMLGGCMTPEEDRDACIHTPVFPLSKLRQTLLASHLTPTVDIFFFPELFAPARLIFGQVLDGFGCFYFHLATAMETNVDSDCDTDADDNYAHD